MAPTEPNGGPQQDADDAYVVRDPEAFARNMAEVLEQLGKAASAWIEPRERGEVIDDGPVGVIDMMSTLSQVSQFWLGAPVRAAEAQSTLFASYLDIWNQSLQRLQSGTASPAGPPDASADKRFADPEWSNNPLFDFMKQMYLSTSRWADDLVAHSEGLDAHTRSKAAFYVRQLTAALSPSNFVLTNPELARETVATNGANLVRGMRMLAEDIAAGHGTLKLRQSDDARFEVGRDMAVTPGKVIAENALCQILQYEAASETVLKRPLLIVPPWINKFYILDLNREKSFIRWAVAAGHTVFVVSWVNPDERHADKDWDDYIDEGIVFGLDTVAKATGETSVNAIGYCVGGTLLAAAVAHLKTRGDSRIQSATFLTTQVDFTHAGDLKIFVDEGQLGSLAESMATKGYLDGARMAAAFNMLRAGDLIWPYFVNNYLKGKPPLPFDLLYWNADSTRMPRANHLFYLRNCYLENRLAKGEMKIGGMPVDLSLIDIPVYSLATKEDHIAPALSVFVGSRLLGPDVTFVLAGSGHIAGVVNPPEKRKYQYWTGAVPTDNISFDDWLATAKETPGSWWPHWQAWIEPFSGPRVKPRRPGGRKMKPIEDAPGSYVRVKACARSGPAVPAPLALRRCSAVVDDCPRPARPRFGLEDTPLRCDINGQHGRTVTPPGTADATMTSYLQAEIQPARNTGAIRLYDAEAFAGMRTACQLTARCLDDLAGLVKPGTTTEEIDAYVFKFALDNGALPATLNYRGYMKSVCTSINHVVCHGIPDDKPLREGDIVNIDVTLIVDGYHGDASRMYPVGKIKRAAERLCEITYQSLVLGMEAVKPGAHMGDIGAAIQTYAEAERCSVVRDFCGHGVGRLFHDAPNVLHYGRRGDGAEMRPGMVFTIEPMINLGRQHVKVLKDGWTAVTRDRSLSAQYEHTVGVTDTGFEIFTSSPGGLDTPGIAFSRPAQTVG